MMTDEEFNERFPHLSGLKRTLPPDPVRAPDPNRGLKALVVVTCVAVLVVAGVFLLNDHNGKCRGQFFASGTTGFACDGAITTQDRVDETYRFLRKYNLQ